MFIQSVEIEKKQKMFDFKKKHIKKEKYITPMENNKGFWNERYFYVSESGWDIQYVYMCIKCTCHCLA